MPRDNFTEAIKIKLASRVGYKCSNPFCRVTTIGPQLGDNGVVKIGEAAHICAASPGGKRYNQNMTSDQRKSYENGIWLCGSHAALIDRDEKFFTIEMLRKWKTDAECEAGNELIGIGIIKKCKFRIRIFYDDLRECRNTIMLLREKRGICVPQTLLPVQKNWENYLEELSDAIGMEISSMLYKILREIEEFKEAMHEVQSEKYFVVRSDMKSVKYCARKDLFLERMDEWLTEEFMNIISVFTEIA